MTDVRTNYREYRPPALLADQLVCLWASRAEGPHAIHKQHVLPDGCVDIVWIGDAKPTVAGPATRHIHVSIPVGVDVVGVRFQPGQAQAMLGLPAVELLNASVALADIWGKGAERFGDAVRAGRSARDKLDLLADASLKQFADRPRGDPAVAASVAWLSARAAARIDRLQHVSGLSPRQLQRRFRSAVGYGPKTFQRVVRLQRLLELSAGEARKTGFAVLAGASGYADQAHMSREVRDLTGQSPSSLLGRGGSTLAMSDLFKTAEH